MATSTATQALKDLRVKVEEHDQFINGNGKEGAKTRLKSLEECDKSSAGKLEKIEKKLDVLMERKAWSSGLLTGLTLIAGLATSLLIWVMTSLIPRIIETIGAP